LFQNVNISKVEQR